MIPAGRTNSSGWRSARRGLRHHVPRRLPGRDAAWEEGALRVRAARPAREAPPRPADEFATAVGDVETLHGPRGEIRDALREARRGGGRHAFGDRIIDFA